MAACDTNVMNLLTLEPNMKIQAELLWARDKFHLMSVLPYLPVYVTNKLRFFVGVLKAFTCYYIVFVSLMLQNVQIDILEFGFLNCPKWISKKC